MSRLFDFKIRGLSETMRKIESYSKDISDQIDERLSLGANNIASSAMANAPKGKTGALSASIRADVGLRFQKRVTVSKPYAAFVEFGTGSKVFTGGFNFTPEMKEYAKDFYVNGKGRMSARPYLFPAFELEKKKIIDDVKRILFKGIVV